ncbi:MAG: PRC-barrel domain-containing protein [Planctomycetota bacterium]
MLIAFQAAMQTTVEGVDCTIGSLQDLIFARESWQIRYLAVATGQFFGRRRALFSPEAVRQIDWSRGSISVDASQEQIVTMPRLDGELPSRHEERELTGHFGWPPYWETTVPVVTEEPPRLWGTKELIGYDVDAQDGEVGYVEDLIFDDHSWRIRYLVVDIGSWLSGRRILAAPDWAHEIDWDSRDVRMNLTKGAIEGGPPFDPNAPVNREYEHQLHDYYGRPKYWEATER